MINITTKELEIEQELKRKIEFICDFCNTKPTIINGNIRNITRTAAKIATLNKFLRQYYGILKKKYIELGTW